MHQYETPSTADLPEMTVSSWSNLREFLDVIRAPSVVH